MARIGVNLGEQSKAIAHGSQTQGPSTAGMSFRDRLKMEVPRTGVEIIQITLDSSGSMEGRLNDGKQRMKAAKDAVRYFLSRSNPATSHIGLETYDGSVTLDPTHVFAGVEESLISIHAAGMTPMHAALKSAISMHPRAHRVINVSDGLPDSEDACFKLVPMYVEYKIPIDCIYIGTEGDRGFDFMKRLAAMTNGIFAFASDLSAFEQAFAKLETTVRLQLTHQGG